ncbi:hypothetical protein Patl1_16239 [Pistacia atlantica]|uniref:Uncharacterized protein n=1 Tax=Pistacia atlantica TaxID=434234 RepID=A0ACC1B690_9ROSI|nr:hypothetical protein Patl1_16239 [Pistacia atlantica]
MFFLIHPMEKMLVLQDPVLKRSSDYLGLSLIQATIAEMKVSTHRPPFHMQPRSNQTRIKPHRVINRTTRSLSANIVSKSLPIHRRWGVIKMPTRRRE